MAADVFGKRWQGTWGGQAGNVPWVLGYLGGLDQPPARSDRPRLGTTSVGRSGTEAVAREMAGHTLPLVVLSGWGQLTRSDQLLPPKKNGRNNHCPIKSRIYVKPMCTLGSFSASHTTTPLLRPCSTPHPLFNVPLQTDRSDLVLHHCVCVCLCLHDDTGSLALGSSFVLHLQKYLPCLVGAASEVCPPHCCQKCAQT